MKTSPTARSLAYLRKNGWTACVVEKWLPARGSMKFPRRIDAFGFADILACRTTVDGPPHRGEIALVQTTVMSGMAAHREKILPIAEFHLWKMAGGIVLLHGWRKLGKRGKRKKWEVAEQQL
jgi:hypothetical protein